MTDDQYDQLQIELMKDQRKAKQSWLDYKNDKVSEEYEVEEVVYEQQVIENQTSYLESAKMDLIVEQNSFVDFFKQNKFKELFQKATMTIQLSKNRNESLQSFFSLITENNLKRIIKANRMIDFAEELNHFLNNKMFNEQEKKAFFNGEEQLCFLSVLNAKNFECAANINKYRTNKSIDECLDFIIEKIEENDFEFLDKLFEMSTSINMGSSTLLRLFYFHDYLEYDKIKYFIEKYELDINGLGSIHDAEKFDIHEDDKWTFAQAVAIGQGTKATIFFEKFFKEFANKIDFDIVAYKEEEDEHYNLLQYLTESELESSYELDRFATILENCKLSEKHIGFIAQYVLDVDSYYTASKYYDHRIFKSLFSHEKFNSNLFDREAFLNKLMRIDTSSDIKNQRVASNYTVNPTSVILDTFMTHAKPALPMEQHPFITWVKEQNDKYSRDTFNSLMILYKDEISNLDLSTIKMHPTLVKALSEHGIDCTAKSGFFSFLKRKKHQEKKAEVKQIMAPQVPEQPKLLTKEVFNTVLLEQVKDEQIKKYIDSIILNLEQFNSLFEGVNHIENHHYMHNLLPKFLNKTIENYLHFATIDEDEAKDNVMVQLKLINKKTFEVLTNGLEHEKNQIATDNVIHHTVLKNY